MTDNIIGLVSNFLKKNDLKDLDIGKIVKNLPVDEILSMVKGNDNYVVKKSGNMEKYNEEKIGRSISNAAERNDMPLNNSDLSMILKSVGSRLFGNDDKKVQRTSDIKDIVSQVLGDEGFSKVRESYDSYVADQI